MYEIIEYEHYDNVYAIVKLGSDEVIFTGFYRDCVDRLEKDLGLQKNNYWKKVAVEKVLI